MNLTNIFKHGVHFCFSKTITNSLITNNSSPVTLPQNEGADTVLNALRLGTKLLGYLAE
jgi:hypothetical protein